MIGECRVTPVPDRAAWHMAPDAVVRRLAMGLDQALAMAGQAARPVILLRVVWFVMWIVTGTAPHPVTAFSRAGAQRQLLDVAHYFELAGGGRVRRNLSDVHGKDFFQLLTGAKIAEAPPRIRDSRFTGQVALLTDTAARSRRKLFGINDIAGRGLAQVGFDRAMAPIAPDSLRLKWRFFIAVQCPCDRAWPSGVAQETFRRHGPREVWGAVSLVAWRHIPDLALRIVGDWRLEKVVANSYKVAKCMIARSHY